MEDAEFDPRENVRRIQAQHAEYGDATGWFDVVYREAAGNNEYVPWADLEPNRFLKAWAERTGLKGAGRTALVVGCGLGDDARFLHELGFRVTAFDISPTAIEWAKKLHSDTDIAFEAADLFYPPDRWLGAFDFVLEVYTIQPLPPAIRDKVIDSVAAFAAEGGSLTVVTRGRGDDEEPLELQWPLSRKDLARFEQNGLTKTNFEEIWDDEDPPVRRFVVEYVRA
jgi:SAM-dependent methyltransferase